MEQGKFDADVDKLMKMKQPEIAKLYDNRDMEPGD
jgi:hypothetical protein